MPYKRQRATLYDMGISDPYIKVNSFNEQVNADDDALANDHDGEDKPL